MSLGESVNALTRSSGGTSAGKRVRRSRSASVKKRPGIRCAGYLGHLFALLAYFLAEKCEK
jgi:hypothetical protein